MARSTPISLACSATLAIMEASSEKKHRNMAWGGGWQEWQSVGGDEGSRVPTATAAYAPRR